LITSEIVDSDEGLRELQPEWTALWERCPHRSVSFTHWWISSFWREAGGRAALRIVLVRDGGHLVLVAPLMRTTVPAGPLAERWLQTLTDYTSAFCDFIYAEASTAYFMEFWNAIDGLPDWDCLAAWPFPRSSETEGMLRRTAESLRMPSRVLSDPDGAVANTARPWHALEASLDRKLRENLRRHRRKLEREHGEIALRRVSSPSQLSEVRGMLQDLNERTRAAKDGGGLRPFHWALMEASAAAGALDLVMLTARGVPVAFELNFRLNRRVTSLAIGYDEAYASYGPGQLLCAEVLRRYCEEEDVDCYDFMPGGTNHKLGWASAFEPYAKIYIYRRHVRARALYAARRAGAAFKEGRLWKEMKARARNSVERGFGGFPWRRLPKARLRVRGCELVVEVAGSSAEMARGLMFRRRLGADEGMLFVVGHRRAEFSMENTSLPLDLAYLDAWGKVMEIHALEPWSTVPVRSRQTVSYAIEAPRGWFIRCGVADGDHVEGVREASTLARSVSPS